ncbi:MAG: bifunctional demethylmenaquinone methyltransferase/2-methoxy-6-polyprenyl-1,4-benzoquinol methylase UbiE [Candidatus Korobacteraceae bacterium]|jgi:demethylmenaquinone methyltransferase/2-methoxy-6-polyprenyl-1,4-benzoquinol methylase
MPEQDKSLPPQPLQQPSSPGARTAGAQDEEAAARAVREMFSSIAPRYDLLNHLLSFNTDRYWWWRAARSFSHILRRPGASVLDVCCGTGDMTFALQRQAARGVRIAGADFSPAMLERARRKGAGKPVEWLEADALRMPFADGSFELVTSAFGFRNLANYDQGLAEIYRVLKNGGEVGIVDFGEPQGLPGKIYNFYFRHILPRVGTLISGVQGPYAYLPASVSRFPSPEQMLARMRQAGFTATAYTPYTFGIAGLYRAQKP